MSSRSAFITLAHGGGGRLQNELIRQEIASRFTAPELSALPDAAVTAEGLVISSDSFVISPRFFRGGDIGKLAVAGTVNDILVSGGIPQYMTCSLIIEEGLPLDELRRILDSMQQTAVAGNTAIITGDTKVVPSGSGDGIYINTAGIGFKQQNMQLGREYFQPGDRIIVSGFIGQHALSIMAERYGLASENLTSDCACLNDVVATLHQKAGKSLKFMRDATRGGVLGIIDEIFEKADCGATVYEDVLPVTQEAAAVAKLLGIDPGFAASEGCIVAVVANGAAEECVNALRKLPNCSAAAIIGEVTADKGNICLRGSWGSLRKLRVPDGDQLPRIC